MNITREPKPKRARFPNRMWTVYVNDKGIQSLLRKVTNDELATALKTASDAVRAKFIKNMSRRAGEILKENMDFMGAVRVSDVELAQRRILTIIRRLEETGDAIITMPNEMLIDGEKNYRHTAIAPEPSASVSTSDLSNALPASPPASPNSSDNDTTRL